MKTNKNRLIVHHLLRGPNCNKPQIANFHMVQNASTDFWKVEKEETQKITHQ